MRDVILYMFDRCLLLFIPTAVIYLILLGVYYFIKRPEKQSISKFFLYFLLIYYLVCVIGITLIFESRTQVNLLQNFYNINWIPFDFVKNGYKELLEQFVWNIIMFVPYGILLPAVIKDKFNRWLLILGTTFIASFLIEFLQYLSGRNTDINDIIANVMGGVTGYALFSIYLFLKNKKTTHKMHKKNVVISFVLAILIPFSIPVTYKIYESTLPYGFISNHYICLPSDAIINTSISNSHSQMMVYKEIPVDSEEKLNEITKKFGINSKYLTDSNGQPVGTSVQLDSGEIINIGLNTSQGYTWYMNIQDPQINDKTRLTTNQLVNKAIAWLNEKGFDVTEDMITSEKAYDKVYIIIFDGFKAKEEMRRIYGNLIIQMDEYGNVFDLEDNRIYFEEFEMSEVTSSKEAIERAKSLPSDSVQRKDVILNEIALDYMHFNNDSYLLPVWRLEGTYRNEDNQIVSWISYVSAIK